MTEAEMQAAIHIVEAEQTDLSAIVHLLADDPLGAKREIVSTPLDAAYHEAFEAIAADPNQRLLVAKRNQQVVGVLQLTFIPGLTYRGCWRAQIEGVRVLAAVRSQGIGRRLLEHAVACARHRGCRMVQLTTDTRRPDARRFYEQLGFVASHHGMKLHLK